VNKINENTLKKLNPSAPTIRGLLKVHKQIIPSDQLLVGEMHVHIN
jgi:hypothetical protein